MGEAVQTARRSAWSPQLSSGAAQEKLPCAEAFRPPRVDILGVGIDPLCLPHVLAIIEEWLGEGLCHLVVTANTELVMYAQYDRRVQTVVSSAALVVPDSVGVMWAARIFGQPLPEQIPGVELLPQLFRVSEATGSPIYLLGGLPGVAPLAAKRLQEVYGGHVAGTHHGYFSSTEESRVVADINRSGAEILCVGMGMPRQELWLAHHRGSLRVSVGVGVGGSLDVWAGRKRRAPRFLRELGLEWLFRLCQEPARARRMAVLPSFVVRVLTCKWLDRR